ncbi:MAG: acetylglutamate kinase [Dehalococcoidia bacterium]
MNKIKPVVVKIGGSTLGSHDTTLQDLVTLQNKGVPLVVVHGGANRVTQWLQRQGASTSFTDGVRVTDDVSLEMVAAVLGGLVNTELVASINALGGQAVGMTGVDGNLLECRITNPALGYAGKVNRVNTAPVKALLKFGIISLIAPPGAKSPDEPADVPYININGDDIAGNMATALEADLLVFLTDVGGIRDGDGNFLPQVSADGVRSLMTSGVINMGMIPKAEAALIALANTPAVKIIDGRVPHALRDAVEGSPIGTTISRQ